MLSKGEPYNPPTDYLFLDQKSKMKLVNRTKKKIAKFDIKLEDVGFSTQLSTNGKNLDVSWNFQALFEILASKK